MSWNIVYLVIAIVVGIVGIWNLARQRGPLLALTGILWFLVILFKLYIPKIYELHIADGVPVIGDLVLYGLIPIFLVFALLTPTRRA
jgi:hypothetical protein